MLALRTAVLVFLLCPFLWGATPQCLQDLAAPDEESAIVAADEPAPGLPSAPSETYQLGSTSSDASQSTQKAPPIETDRKRGLPGTEKNFFRNLVYDQKVISTSPFHLKAHDAKWLVPFAGITGGLIASDARAMQLERSRPEDIKTSDNVANAGVAGLGALSLGIYAWGRLRHNPHARETGVLSLEALTNSLLLNGSIRAVTWREGPDKGNGRGAFYSAPNPFAASFPSDHSVAAWSLASVIAHEYPGWFTQAAVYSAATAVSVARVSGRKHFPSDVVVGSALGWMIGRYVYRAHHDPDLGGENIGVFTRADRRRPRPPSSPYVPLDSWVYGALYRLAAMGYINTQIAGQQPWTRLECERQVQEARTTLNAMPEPPAAVDRMIGQLEREFTIEKEAAQGVEDFQQFELESVYFRYLGIAGTPVRDSFHFGQTIVNDFGRPFGEGSNVATGFSARAVDGPFSFYVRGEYQHAPGAPGRTLAVRQFIANTDQVPLPSANAIPDVDRFRVLDAYAGVTLGNYYVTFGKQSLWWGPSRSGPLILSNNAEPMYMLRIANMHPYRLPGVFRYLGDVKSEFFFGKLTGHHVPARPYLHGQKITLKITPNLEVGFSRTATFAGQGHSPFTLGTFATSFFSVGDQVTGANAAGKDPGDRHGQFDFSYRVPKLRNWLTIYSDSYVDDDPSPLAAPRRAAFNPGFYLSRLPGLPRVDLRAESVYTDVPAIDGRGHFIYWNTVYHNGYTSDGNLTGNWIGRQGKGFQVWSTYWHSAQSTVQVGWRNAKIARSFVPGGGTQNDIFATANIFVRPNLSVTGTVQHEAWLIPLVKPGLQHDWSAAFQVAVFPKLKKRDRMAERTP